MAKYNLKLYPSPVDQRDHVIKVASNVLVKSSGATDLSAFCTSVKDQGELGSCTAFAAVAALEFLHKRFGGSRVDDMFSERFTYYATRVNILKWEPEDSGAYVRDAIKSLVKYGTCLEPTCAYSSDCRTQPTNDAYVEAMKFQALSYAKFEDGKTPDERRILIESLKVNLDAGLPIVCGFICYSNIWSAVRGSIPQSNGQIIGGHAVLLVGYNDATKMFKFKNSWGAGWGDNGYGYLPYDYYILGDMFDLWSVHKSELEDIKSVGLEVTNPTIKRNIDKSDVTAILEEITSKLDNLLDRKQSMAIMNEMIKKYSKKPKLVSLLGVLKSQLYNIAS